MPELDDTIEKRLQEVAAAREINWSIYQQWLNETALLLHGSPQLVQDVLTVQCVERGERPFEALSLVHDFLKTFTERQQQAQTKLEQESPYFGRQA